MASNIPRNPYGAMKAVQPLVTICETCDRSILTKDWLAHSTSKKHRQNLEASATKNSNENHPVNSFAKESNNSSGFDNSGFSTNDNAAVGNDPFSGGAGFSENPEAGGDWAAESGWAADNGNSGDSGFGAAADTGYGASSFNNNGFEASGYETVGHGSRQANTSRSGGGRGCFNCGEEG